MSSIEFNFKSWMLKPGIVKQLQLYLFVSILLNILLVQQLLNINLKQVEAKKSIKVKKIIEEVKPQLSENDFKNFIQEYLGNFFSIEESALAYLQKHTDIELYENLIQVELLNRRKQKIHSKFNLEDIYIEEVNSNQVKAICIGREEFLADNYLPRNFTIEFIVDVLKLKVVSIPVFKVS